MKKNTAILIFVFVLALLIPSKALAQINYGIKGGINFTSFSYFQIGEISEAVNSYTGFNAGAVVKFKLPYGFAIQPELNYVSKGARFSGGAKVHLRTDYIELPVNIQIGLDLIMLRPYIAVTPYIGYAVSKDVSIENQSFNETFGWNQYNRFEYGIGIGGGVEFWRFQVSARYNWNIGNFTHFNTEGFTDPVTENVIKTINKGNFRGLEISVAFLFSANHNKKH